MLILFFSLLLFIMPVCFGQANLDKPNLIVILADDLGYKDVGFNGCQDIPTPNIDRLASNGVVFTNGYTTYSVCGPSRAGFITGRYQQRFGFERNPQYKPTDPNMGLPKDENTIADILADVGYQSGIIGKWHLGADISNHPLNRGFTEFYGHLGGGHRYFPEELTIQDSYSVSTESESYITWILRNHIPEKTDEYLTDEFSNEAVDFVVRHKDQPFFLYLSYNAPHSPLQATEKYLSRFASITDSKRRTYAAMVSAIDDGVGRLLDSLQANNMEENTIIFFLSDNGGPESTNASDNGPLREGKSSVYEGGFRVPFVMQWKGTIDKQIFNLPVSSLDIAATISSLAGAPANSQKPLDGVNLIPFLNGTNANSPHETIYLRKFDQDRYAVRDGDYKLIVLEDGTNKQLYNLRTDLGEWTNLYSKNTDIYQRLDSLRIAWDKELIHPVFLGLIHVDDIVADDISLSHDLVQLTSDSSFQLEASVLPSESVNQTLIWSSSDTTVVKVNQQGFLTAVKQGNVIITVSVIDAPAVKKECVVNVKSSNLNKVKSEIFLRDAKIYPNPVEAKKFSIEFGTPAKLLDLVIYNISGAKKNSTYDIENQTLVHVNSVLEPGEYIIAISTDSYQTTRKIVVL